jgi:lipoprotein-anchoring transpeptidase ErfK/SrfK
MKKFLLFIFFIVVTIIAYRLSPYRLVLIPKDAQKALQQFQQEAQKQQEKAQASKTAENIAQYQTQQQAQQQTNQTQQTNYTQQPNYTQNTLQTTQQTTTTVTFIDSRPILQQGNNLIAENKLYEVWQLYSKAMKDNIDYNTRKHIKHTLDQIVPQFLSNPQATGAEYYTVKPGDNLTKIARKNKTSIEFIRYLNNKKNDNLRASENLLIINSIPYIEIYQSSYFLVLYLPNGLYCKSYEVCIGANNKTPVKNFTIKEKIKEPAWYTEENGKTVKILYGDPRHAIGTRWLGFQDDGLGIHGTNDPASIGKSLSHGCTRLRNEEVEELYEIVSINTQVSIKR